jgi:uncharacterized membrane protein
MTFPTAPELEFGKSLPSDETLSSRAKAELVQFLPAWMFFFYACMLLNAGLTNVSPPRYDLSVNVVFPLATFVGFYWIRAARASDVENRWFLAIIVTCLAICLPLLNIAYHRPSPLTGKGLLIAYELSNFVVAALMWWHARRQNRGHAWLFFGCGFLYGLLLENGGILMGFFHETNLTLTLVRPLVAPVATILGWCIVLYMASFLVWQLRQWMPSLQRRPALSGFLVAVLGTSLDVQIDPLATASGAWVWHETLPPWFHGVPLVNFVAWICALTPFAWVMFRAQEHRSIDDGGHWNLDALMRMGLAVPAALTIAAVMFMTSMALVEGFHGPSWTLLNQFGMRLLATL